VEDPAQAAHAIRQEMNNADHAVALRVIRNGQPVFVGIQMGNAG